MIMDKRILIIGAGPCGLGAGHRLKELNYHNFTIYEKENYVGGLSSSFLDDKGFTWDIGGHVLFSKIDYFNNLIDKILDNDYFEHQRTSWVYLKGHYIPYPFQNNIHYLETGDFWQAFLDLAKVFFKKDNSSNNFYEWIINNFGKKIAELFMLPYNNKVWQHDPKDFSYSWISQRVSRVKITRLLKNYLLKKPDSGWGPNVIFKFPVKGGTGSIWRKIAAPIDKHIVFSQEVEFLDAAKKILEFKNGQKQRFDFLITTMPLDQLVKRSNLDSLKESAKKLKHNSGLMFGAGMRGSAPSNKNWVYFPQSSIPFYRLTYFSNYSLNNTPPDHCSVMTETSFKHKIDQGVVIKNSLENLKKHNLIDPETELISQNIRRIDYCYPLPTLSRDHILRKIQPALENRNIYSRGRFGAWLYEVGNMDHSFMQGVEAINKILLNKKETIWHL